MNYYNSLSNYLNDKINNTNTIDEGIFDFLKKSKKNNASENNNNTFGIFAWAKALITPPKKENKILQAYKEAAKAAKEKEKENLRKQREADIEKEVAAIKAQSAHKLRQMELVHNQKMAAKEAITRKLKDAEEAEKSSNLIMTAEESAAWIQNLRDSVKEHTDDSDEAHMSDLILQITINPETGEAYSHQEIQDKIDNDSEFKKLCDEYDKLADKNGEKLIAACKDDEDAFNRLVANVSEIAYNNKYSEKDLTNAENNQQIYNASCNAVKSVNDAVNAYNKKIEDADKVVTEAKDKKTALESNPLYNKNQDEALEPDVFKAKLKDLIIDASNDDKTDITKLKAYLEKNGMNSDDLEKIFPSNSISEINETNITSAIEAVTDNQIFIDAAKNTQDKIKSDIDKAITDIETAENNRAGLGEKLEMPVKEEDLSNLDLGENAKDITDAYKDIINDEDGKKSLEEGLFDTSKDPGKKYKKDLDNAVTAAKNKKAEVEAERQANKIAAEAARARNEERKKTDVPEKVKTTAAEKAKGLEAGEIYKDGKIGIMVGNEFVEKPTNDSKKEQEEYIQKRNQVALEMDVNSKDYGNDFDSIKGPDTNGKYTCTIDGVEKSIPEEKAIQFLAQKKAKTIAKEGIIRKKQILADTIKKVVNPDGTLNEKELAKLKNSKKPEDIQAYNDFNAAINSKKSLKEILSGIDLQGKSDTADAIDALVKNKHDLKTEFNELDDGENGEWEDVNDEDEELNDDNEYEGEETDEKGNKIRLKNPAKIWKRKKKKSGDGLTKSYYSKEKDNNGNYISISTDEYKQKVEAYKAAKRKKQQQGESRYFKLKNHLQQIFS